MSLKSKILITIAICENECRLYNDDGFIITWSEKKPLSELPELIEEAKIKSEKYEKENDNAKALKTIITAETIDNPNETYPAFALGHYAMHYITYEAIKEHWIHERPGFKERIHKIQNGLF
jgi:hypothetical protein